MLEKLLEHLEGQVVSPEITFSVIVVDNDGEQSAQAVVERFNDRGVLDIAYYSEPRQNIALARNSALRHARGDFLALIDDDEFPGSDWLVQLYQACKTYHADGVLGPVCPSFMEPPPRWVLAGRFHEKGGHESGEILSWRDTRTSNVLLRRATLSRTKIQFDATFSRGGEDVDFFTRLMRAGCKFVWCQDAPVFETIPPVRCTRKFMLKRALLRGCVTTQYVTFGPWRVVKSVAAVPVYAAALPLTVMLGQHRAMDVLIRLVEHAGLLMATCGLEPVKER